MHVSAPIAKMKAKFNMAVTAHLEAVWTDGVQAEGLAVRSVNIPFKYASLTALHACLAWLRHDFETNVHEECRLEPNDSSLMVMRK